jgi:polysaccharide biosynthesis protein PslF
MGVRIGVVSTYPPTQCGIASFSRSLVEHLVQAGSHVDVVRIVDEPQEQVLPVSHQWVRGTRSGIESTARVLNDLDVVVVQHEYGIFGGRDGQDVVTLVERLHVPVITVLHTVLTHPTPNQRRIVAELARHSAALVTMTETGRDRLIALWGVDPATVVVIPHGAVDNRSSLATTSATPHRPVILTWGLLSPGKGIEWAIRALAELRGTMDLPLYHVVGRTHPRVLELHGEDYRESLVALAHELGLDDDVVFDGHYLPSEELRGVVRRADVVLLPYDSLEQVTSGVLTEAVAAGKPVISTSFPHATELLGGGAGVLVPQRDPSAIAAAVRTVMCDVDAASRMAHVAGELAVSLLWPTVAARYVELAGSVVPLRLRSAV